MSAVALSAQELQQIAAAPGWRGGSVSVVDLPVAGKVVVKGMRTARHPARHRLLNGIAQLLGLPLLKAAPILGGAQAQQTEVARLRALHGAGVCVPEVLHVGADHFVMQWLGREHLANLLHDGHPQSAALWREGGRALVRLHAAGQYLSQGFARNMIVDDAQAPAHLAGMIDFEDDPLQVMSLPDAQVRDWLNYLHSTLWMLQMPAAQVDTCIDDWLRAESPAVRALFLRACRTLAWLRVLPRQRRWGRDTVALQAAAAAAHRYLRRQAGSAAARQTSD